MVGICHELWTPADTPPSITHTHTQPSGDEVRQINAGLFKPSAIVPAAGVRVIGINPPRTPLSDANLPIKRKRRGKREKCE